MMRKPSRFTKASRTDVSRRAFLIGAASLVAAPSFAQGAAGAEAFVAPNAEGDGSSPDNAARFEQIGDLVDAVGPGGTVYLLSDRGEYRDWETAYIRSGGSASAPVKIAGVNSRLRASAPRFVGSRRRWTRPGSERGAVNAAEFGGNTAFRFEDGASHLHFMSLSFANVGRIFDFAGQRSSGIIVQNVDFLNVRDGFFTDEDSDLRNIILHRFSGVGFSKKGVRIHGRSRNWLVENCELDSRWQYGDNFAVGIELNNSARDITIRGGFTINCLDTQDGDQERYWNADGVASERGNRNLQISDHRSSGHTDGGYDLKSEDTVLTRCIASDNKRNYRVWGGTRGNPVQLTDCQSITPRARGGIGAPAHLWLSGVGDAGSRAASAVFRGGLLKDRTPGSAAVYTDGDGVVVHFVDTDLSGLGRRQTLVEGEGERQTVIVGSASDPDLTSITTQSDITALENLALAVPLMTDGQASWRLVDGPEDDRFAILGASLIAAPASVGTVDSMTVQARGSNGNTIERTLNVSVAPNPIGPGVALAVMFTGPDGSTSASDQTGLNQVMFAGDAAIHGDAVQFSRGDDFITIPDSDNFSFEGPFTIDTEFMLFNPREEGGQDVFSHWGDPSRQRGYMIRAEEDGTLAFVWTYDGTDQNMSIIDGPVLEANRFYKIRIDRDAAGTVRLYVDGEMVGSVPDSLEPILNSAASLRISGRDSGKYGANGRMKSIMITKGHALTGSDAGYQP